MLVSFVIIVCDEVELGFIVDIKYLFLLSQDLWLNFDMNSTMRLMIKI